MRLIRYGEPGREQPGLWRDGRTVALRRIFPDIPDIGEAFFRDGWLERLRAVDDPGVAIAARLGPPVTRPSKIVCLGINYAAHGSEGGFKRPERPILFAKTPEHAERAVRPDPPAALQREDRLGGGTRGHRRPGRRAHPPRPGARPRGGLHGHERRLGPGGPVRRPRQLQWFRGKSFDTFAPLGPCLVTADEIGDPGDLLWKRSWTGS